LGWAGDGELKSEISELRFEIRDLGRVDMEFSGLVGRESKVESRGRKNITRLYTGPKVHV
jgi:hypothetical protein